MGRIAKPYYRTSDGYWYGRVHKGIPAVRILQGKPTDADRQRASDLFAILKATSVPGTNLDRQPCAVLIDKFLEYQHTHNELGTYRTHLQYLTPFAKFCGSVRCIELTAGHAEKFITGKRNQKRQRIVRTLKTKNKDGTYRQHVTYLEPWGDNTVAAFTKSLLAAFNWGTSTKHSGKLISSHPFDGQRRQFQRTDRVVVKDDAFDAMYAAAKPAFKDFLTALRCTGCRPGELMVVTAADIRDGDKFILQKHKTSRKTGKPRIVWFDDTLKDLIARKVQEHPEGPLFRNTDGNPWSRGSISSSFDRLRTKLNLTDNVIAYALGRHSYITSALERGVDIVYVSELTGTSVPTIQKFYSHVGENAQRMRAAAQQATRQASGA